MKYLNICEKDVNSYLYIRGLFVYANYNIAGFQVLPKMGEKTQMKGPVKGSNELVRTI